jgi:hypothetical protein
MKAEEEMAEAIIQQHRRSLRAIRGLMRIAETAMPDTYFAEDSRTKYARKVIEELRKFTGRAKEMR